MSLFRPRDFLFALLPVITGNTHLLAFHLPVELPSGPTIHLGLDELYIDSDNYAITMHTSIDDLEEQRFLLENPEILEIIGQFIQEKWGGLDFEFDLYDPNKTTPPWIGSLTDGLGITPFIMPSLNQGFLISNSTPLYSSSLNGGLLSAGTLTLTSTGVPIASVGSCGGACLVSCGSASMITLDALNTLSEDKFEMPSGAIYLISASDGCITFESFLRNTASSNGEEDEIKRIAPGDSIFFDHAKMQTIKGSCIEVNTGKKEDEKSIDPEISLPASSTTLEINDDATLITSADSAEADNTMESGQNEIQKPLCFILTFKSVGIDFGGGWRLIPYELRFIKNQLQLGVAVEEMALVLAPNTSQLYQKEYNNIEFSSLRKTDKSLKTTPDNTFVLSTPSRGDYIFDKEGKLIHAMKSDGGLSTYEYSKEQLAAIHHENSALVAPEYEGGRVVALHGLPHEIYLHYDENDKLSKILDEQGACLCFSYVEYELDDMTDESGTIFSIDDSMMDVQKSNDNSEIPLLFNGFGEVFYYKNPQNLWKFSYRNWDFEVYDKGD